jgi:hypothetical protein
MSFLLSELVAARSVSWAFRLIILTWSYAIFFHSTFVKGLTRRYDTNPEKHEQIYARGWKGGLWRQVRLMTMILLGPPGVFKYFDKMTWMSPATSAQIFICSTELVPWHLQIRWTKQEANWNKLVHFAPLLLLTRQCIIQAHPSLKEETPYPRLHIFWAHPSLKDPSILINWVSCILMIYPRVWHPSPYGQQAQCVIVASLQLFDFDQLECFCLLSARQWGVILLEAFGYGCLLSRF